MASPLEMIAAHQAARPGRRKRRKKTLRPIQARPADRVAYYGDLKALVGFLALATQETLFPLLNKLEPQYLRDATLDTRFTRVTVDGFGEEFNGAFESIQAQFTALEQYADQKAQEMVGEVNKAHAKRYFAQVQGAIGVDLEAVLSQERLQPVIESAVAENVGLIKSIPAEYWPKLERIVYAGTVSGDVDAGSMIDQIKGLWDVTDSRARLIARDQTAKTNSAINTERNLALGLEEYIWKTAGDGLRVRATHRAREGKTYRYDTPPAGTGHPGQDIQCRCVAISIIPEF